jgi:hypothetical protein
MNMFKPHSSSIKLGVFLFLYQEKEALESLKWQTRPHSDVCGLVLDNSNGTKVDLISITQTTTSV